MPSSLVGCFLRLCVTCWKAMRIHTITQFSRFRYAAQAPKQGPSTDPAQKLRCPASCCAASDIQDAGCSTKQSIVRRGMGVGVGVGHRLRGAHHLVYRAEHGVPHGGCFDLGGVEPIGTGGLARVCLPRELHLEVKNGLMRERGGVRGGGSLARPRGPSSQTLTPKHSALDPGP